MLLLVGSDGMIIITLWLEEAVLTDRQKGLKGGRRKQIASEAEISCGNSGLKSSHPFSHT